MLRKLQTDLNHRLERLQDRWDTDASFRRTGSIGGGLAALVLLVTCLSLSLQVSNGLLAGAGGNPGATAGASTTGQQQGGAATFTVPPKTPNPAPNIPGAVPINTSTAAAPTATVPPTAIASPGTTPTVTPTPGAGTPTVTPGFGTPTVTPGAGTPQPVVVITAQQQAVWNAGQAANIQGLTTTPPQKNAQVQIQLVYAPNCTQTLPPVNLDGNGTNPNVNFIVPTCFHGANQTVTATLTIVGVANSANQLEFIANGATGNG